MDYDGTLAVIVNDPDKAYLSDEMHRTLQEVTRLFTTSIVSGRAIEKVFNFVGIKDINYAGSHGLDIKLSTTTESSSASGEIVEEGHSYQPAQEHLAAINKVYNSLLRATDGIDGATVENNKYCVSVHYRNVAKENQARVREVVEEVLEASGDGLKMTEGHMVRPPTRWNKGDAAVYLLENLGFRDPSKVFPIYIGDDRTDEDAFRALQGKDCGVGILVSEANRETWASYSLRNPSEVGTFLNKLIQAKAQMI
nr:unnamed protein product [Digitaria exilis]